MADYAELLHPDDPHRLAHLGALRSARWSLEAMLESAGREIDARPQDATAARYRTLSLRHAVERTYTELLDRFSHAFGPRPFVASNEVAQRHADTHLYLRQHHAERDLQSLGEVAFTD